MKKWLFILLIFCFSLTFISCTEKDENTTTTTSEKEESCTTDDTTTTNNNTTQMGGSRQGVELSLLYCVTTLAGTGSTGSSNGTGTSASFNSPIGITTDGTNLYVADQENHLIRKIVISTGAVTTVAGTSANFNSPYGITTDGTNLYVADSSNHLIRKIVISTGAVTTLAGTGSSGSADNSTGTSASFYNPEGSTNSC